MTSIKQYLLDELDYFPSGGTDRPFLTRSDGKLTLQFDYLAIQSQMNAETPDSLVLAYTRVMMGFLLFNPAPRRIAMIGLGGGSLAKYCHRYLPDAHFTAVEINPRILSYRNDFHIPEDGPRFSVLCTDGADYVRNDEKCVDVLLIDGFDGNRQPPQLCDQRFYDDCFAKLNAGGVMVVNFWRSDPDYEIYASRIQRSFDGNALAIHADHRANKIVFACKNCAFPTTAADLMSRLIEPDPDHPLGLLATARKIASRLRQPESLRVTRTSGRY